MEKIWYIFIDNKQVGPFSVDDLCQNSSITPDTLICQAGWKEWKAIRDIPELKKIFEDKAETSQNIQTAFEKELPPDQSTLVITQPDPLHPMVWIILIILTVLYLYILFH